MTFPNDLTDEELPGYALAHCETKVAVFHKSHIIRLCRMAGLDDKAEELEADFREWHYLGPRIIAPLVEKIRERQQGMAALLKGD